MQILTEEQTLERDEVFYLIMEDFIDESYEVDDDYVMTEEDQAMVEAIKEFFDSNFRYPTLEESALEQITNYDINTELYEELAEVLLDESIGKAVAGAKYFISQAMAQYRKSSAAKSWQKSKDKHIALAAKNAPAPKTTVPKAGDVVKPAKNAFQAKKADRVAKRVSDAKVARDKALSKKRSTEVKAGNIAGRKEELAKNIDAKIKNTKEGIINRAKELKNKVKTTATSIKDKVKSAITKTASKVGGAAGDIAGRFA